MSKTAFIKHIVTDQGNGGAYCSSCEYMLGCEPFALPTDCPRCGAALTDSGDVFIPTGGSDFL